eukprot:187064_1
MKTRSFIYFAAFSTVGLLFGTMGPILTNLEQQLHINLDVISYLFFANAIGFMLGSISGGIISNNYPKQTHRALGGGMLIGAIAFCCFPFCKTVLLLYFCAIFVGWSAGQTATVGNVCMLILFDSKISEKTGSSESGPYMQFLHFSYALGPLICPSIVQISISLTGKYHNAIFFMVALMSPVALVSIFTKAPIRSENKNVTETQNLENAGNDKIIENELDNLIAKGSSYGSIPIFAEVNKNKRLFAVYSWCMVVTFACFISLYCGAEWSYGAYTTLFGMEYLHMSDIASRMFCSSYWFGFTGGRLLGVWIALNIKTETILKINLSGSFLSMSILSIIIYFTSWNTMYISWILSILYGLFMSSTYPAMFTILEETIVVNGNYAMVLLLGNGVGAGIVPMIVGHIMYSFGIYALILTSFVMTTMIVMVYLISNVFRFRINKIKRNVKFKEGKRTSSLSLHSLF